MSATSERLALTAREVGVLRPGSAAWGVWYGRPEFDSNGDRLANPRHGWWLLAEPPVWLGRGENAAHEALRRLARDKEAR